MNPNAYGLAMLLIPQIPGKGMCLQHLRCHYMNTHFPWPFKSIKVLALSAFRHRKLANHF
uniref:Uncharacterized protein n=1 Tax=Rhizophora mucronata TaxID=61149 RepID=A0A2P2IYY9_RHIMU